MKTIEFFGVPGAGKSTLLGYVLIGRDATWHAGERFRSGQHGLQRLVSSQEEWATFCNLVADTLATARDQNARRYRKHVWRTVRRVASIETDPRDGFAMLDGGLAQRGLSVALSQPGSKSLIADYFHAMPAPAAVVVVEADRETVIARNRTREGRRDLSAYVDRLFPAFVTGATILKDRGVPMLHIDGSCPAAQSVEQVRGLCRNLAEAA